jgi:sulfur transfer protein SufE
MVAIQGLDKNLCEMKDKLEEMLESNDTRLSNMKSTVDHCEKEVEECQSKLLLKIRLVSQNVTDVKNNVHYLR